MRSFGSVVMAAPARWKILAALGTLYFVWGSTYPAIKVSVRTLPPFLSAGSRFLLAGALLAAILWVTGRSVRVTRRELASSALVGLALMLGASVSWSLGSFFGHRLPLPPDGFVATTWEMLSAGFFLLVLAVARGELGTIDPGSFSLESLGAWLYLLVFGSLIGFTAYAWLLRNAPISKVVTHQYVNPLVAIALGALLLGEEITLATGIGAALIVGSVFVAVRHESSTGRSHASADGRGAPADQTA